MPDTKRLENILPIFELGYRLFGELPNIYLFSLNTIALPPAFSLRRSRPVHAYAAREYAPLKDAEPETGGVRARGHVGQHMQEAEREAAHPVQRDGEKAVRTLPEHDRRSQVFGKTFVRAEREIAVRGIRFVK